MCLFTKMSFVNWCTQGLCKLFWTSEFQPEKIGSHSVWAFTEKKNPKTRWCLHCADKQIFVLLWCRCRNLLPVDRFTYRTMRSRIRLWLIMGIRGRVRLFCSPSSWPTAFFKILVMYYFYPSTYNHTNISYLAAFFVV